MFTAKAVPSIHYYPDGPEANSIGHYADVVAAAAAHGTSTLDFVESLVRHPLFQRWATNQLVELVQATTSHVITFTAGRNALDLSREDKGEV